MSKHILTRSNELQQARQRGMPAVRALCRTHLDVQDAIDVNGHIVLRDGALRGKSR